jgi:chromosome segregation ATPase
MKLIHFQSFISAITCQQGGTVRADGNELVFSGTLSGKHGDTKEQIKVLSRQARQAPTLQEQHDIQEKIRKLERQQRRQRQEIFDAEDQILEKRDALIDSLQRRLSQDTTSETVFTLRWRVV